jgi:hypothetical protein
MSYSKIDEASLDTATSALDLFKAPTTKTSTLKGCSRQINPIGNANGSQIDFEFRTSSFDYWDPENTRLLVELKVEKADGSALGATSATTVMPVSNLLHALFQIVTLSINNNDISYEPNYPHVAYLETLVSRSGGYKKTIGQSSLWIEDDFGPLDQGDIGTGHASAVTKRKALISSSKKVELCDRLHLPMFNQDRYILPNTSVKLSLTRSSPQFCLLKTDGTDANDYRIVINKCLLLIHEVAVNPVIINAHNTLLAAGNKVMYPVNQVETQMFTISVGKQSERIPIRINQQYPKRATFVFIDHEAKNGDWAKDPFKFKNFDVKRIGLDVDGNAVPSKAIEINFSENTFAHAYHNLAVATGKAFGGGGDHGITMKRFAENSSVFMFDLTPDACEGSGSHLINFGSLTLEVTFGTALPATVSVFAYLERDELYKFDNEKTLEKLPRI